MINSKKEQLLKEIIQLIDSIKEHADDISGELHIPSLELQTICAKINKLHDKTIILSYLEAQVEEKLEHTPVEDLKDILTDIEVMALEMPESLLVSKPIVVETKEEPVEAIVEQKTDLIIEEEAPIIKVVEPEIKPITTPEVMPVAAKPVAPNKPPISDLKVAITINTRLQLINNLFKGNSEAFNAAISQLNSADNYTNAVNELSKLKDEYRWPNDNELYVLLVELIQRRYSN